MSVSIPSARLVCALCSCLLLTLGTVKSAIAANFLYYQVKLTSLKLVQSNGTAVEIAAGGMPVDLAQLVDFSAAVSAGNVPAATYVGASATLDFSTAHIVVDNGHGVPVTLEPLDTTGRALTGPVTMKVQLQNQRSFLLSSTSTNQLDIDFNLSASNAVRLAGATVEVYPKLVANLVTSVTKPESVSGGLAQVDVAEERFVLKTSGARNRAAPLTILTSSTTTYTLYGTVSQGDAGLQALSSLPAGTAVTTQGTLQVADNELTATQVSVGN